MTTAVKADPPARIDPPTTAEGLLAWPDDDPGEIVDGVFVPKYPDGVMTGGGGAHGLVALEIGFRFRLHVQPENLGEAFAAETGFRLRRNPDLVRCPDVAVVVADRLVDEVPSGVIEGAPDLAVEVVSPTNRTAGMERRVADYLAYGARIVWVADPELRTVVVHTTGAPPRAHQGDDVLDGGDVLPGFRVSTRTVFARLARTRRR